AFDAVRRAARSARIRSSALARGSLELKVLLRAIGLMKAYGMFGDRLQPWRLRVDEQEFLLDAHLAHARSAPAPMELAGLAVAAEKLPQSAERQGDDGDDGMGEGPDHRGDRGDDGAQDFCDT